MEYDCTYCERMISFCDTELRPHIYAPPKEIFVFIEEIILVKFSIPVKFSNLFGCGIDDTSIDESVTLLFVITFDFELSYIRIIGDRFIDPKE